MRTEFLGISFDNIIHRDYFIGTMVLLIFVAQWCVFFSSVGWWRRKAALAYFSAGVAVIPILYHGCVSVVAIMMAIRGIQTDMISFDCAWFNPLMTLAHAFCTLACLEVARRISARTGTPP